VIPLSDTGWRANDPAIDALADFPSAQRRHGLQLGESERSVFSTVRGGPSLTSDIPSAAFCKLPIDLEKGVLFVNYMIETKL
jgi:hypothetical protein